MNAITSRIKTAWAYGHGGKKRRPQDGRIKTLSAEGNEIELRLSTMPTAFGEKTGDAHFFTGHFQQGTLSHWGFTQAQANKWNNWTKIAQWNYFSYRPNRLRKKPPRYTLPCACLPHRK